MGAWHLSLPHPAATDTLTLRFSREGSGFTRYASENEKFVLVFLRTCSTNGEKRPHLRKQQNQRQDVFPEEVESRPSSGIRRCMAIMTPAITRKGCPDQPVKEDKAENGFHFENRGREAEYKDPIAAC
jgi:hypothetical protein